ncbi:glycosyltransferase family 4 protein [Streptomyces sp. SID13666]|uniref:glycosyltransferase family 4 protein n=1 Tax=Streptomyces TaxID=1883 RepID=UPI001106EC4D|nr:MULTISPECIES: glycosyltransferase family 4 protein [Streptomyces]MCZ4096569.1 glycosyltransferase family 4 protein [Streptomyces sp. H39-C1]NEA60568.1 glycosyltransferase family 4 protein [Streptomyces sp. SID13666]NEA71389.1 glycosyltransferase family 4 protein [Streptomyces sp. SID13588]QNA72684.1 glycosyltransferase family 4 protein [Streptomyces sp. So13.3]
MSSTPIPPRGQLHAVLVLGGAGGPAGAHVSSLAGGLVARGVRVTVCGPAAAENDYALTATGARFEPVEIAHRAARSDATVITELRVACTDADVVHAHGLRAGLLSSLALSGRSTPLVVTWHSAVLVEGARARLLRWLERRVVRAAAVVLGASSDLVDRARTLGARDARLAPVAVPVPRVAAPEPHGDAERMRQKTRAEFGAVDRPLVLAVGRLEPHKGYDLLLDACRMLADHDPRPLVIVAGEGSRRAALEQRIDTERLPVRLIGRRADVTELLAAADVVVLPSRWEARALIAQEALHAGVPLVATAVGGIPELVGDAAELVPYGDPGALARMVARLLDEPERRLALAAAGRAQAATWPTEDDTVAQVLSIYDELAQR